jgi:hypothetical protein
MAYVRRVRMSPRGRRKQEDRIEAHGTRWVGRARDPAGQRIYTIARTVDHPFIDTTPPIL